MGNAREVVKAANFKRGGGIDLGSNEVAGAPSSGVWPWLKRTLVAALVALSRCARAGVSD